MRCGIWAACRRNTAPTVLSAAFNNLAEEQDLTRRYADLCRHYGMRASRCNPGQSHENGSIESRNDSLKTALDQALRLRGSRSFDDRQSYEAFVQQIVSRMNARVIKRLAAERPMLKLLPVRRTAEYEELPARVSKYAIFRVKSEQYSAPSQLIGHRLMVRQYAHHIECWLGGQCVLQRDPGHAPGRKAPCARHRLPPPGRRTATQAGRLRPLGAARCCVPA